MFVRLMAPVDITTGFLFSMNDFDLLNWLWTLLGVPVAFGYTAIRSLQIKLDVAHKRISDHELKVAEFYVRTENFTRLETKIFEKLDKIEKKIDAKADKTNG